MSMTRKEAARFRLRHSARYPYDHEGEGPIRPVADWAEAAARGVLADLCDRCGIKWALQDEDIGQATRLEIVTSLADIIREAQTSEPT